MNPIQNILDKLNLLENTKERVSITNSLVFLCMGIVLFRSLFGGSSIDLKYFTWNIQAVDTGTALTALFSLWNYNEKRKQVNTLNNNDNGSNNANQ